MQFIIFIEILFAPAKFKLDTDDILISSVSLVVFCILLALLLNQLLKKSNNLFFQKYEKSNMDFAYSISSVFTSHSIYSGQLLKKYAEFPAIYRENVSADTRIAFDSTGLYKNEIFQNQNLFYEINKDSYSSLKLLRENYPTEIYKAISTLNYYDLELSFMKDRVFLQNTILEKAADTIGLLKSTNKNDETTQLIEKLASIGSYTDDFAYLTSAAYSDFETLGNLKTDDLRFEVELIVQQLFDTYHNYGNTIYSLLDRYFSQLNLSLKEFSDRSDEYAVRMGYTRLVSEIRRGKNIDANTLIIPVNLVQDYRDAVGVKAQNSKADFYILQFRNDFSLYPNNINSSDLYIAFDIDVSSGSSKVDLLEPAVCTKLNDKEYKIINKGTIRFS